ncbi:MAG: tRNA-dependent cyclodipeptide synthase [Ferruginibacter sp.]
MDTLIKIMSEKVNHKVKRIYPLLITEAEKIEGITELSRLEIDKRLQQLYSKKSFMAVSLSGNEFSENNQNPNLWRTEIILDWITNSFGKVDFLVSDSLYRYYNQMLYGFNELEALNKGLADGKKFIENCRNKISELELKQSDFDFLKWSDITNELDFKILHERFKKLFNENKELREAIIQSANIFIERNLDKIKIDYNKARLFANDVIIEELAVFSYMGELGYEGHIYPSTFMQVLMDISEGAFENIPSELLKQALIQIKIVTK